MNLSIRNKRLLIYLLGSIGTGFLLLTIFVMLVPAPLLDREFSHELQEHQNPLLDSMMAAISWFGYPLYAAIMVTGTAFIFFIFNYRREALYVLLTLTSGLISTIIKFLVNRPRPSAPLIRIMGTNQQQSFPSGHVLFYVIFFGFLVLLMFRIKSILRMIRLMVTGICMTLIFTIPVSRIYLGAHWFTDVLGGFLLGLLCLYILSYLYLKKKQIAAR
jgi:membrane-associated phospholipid phosphatase